MRLGGVDRQDIGIVVVRRFLSKQRNCLARTQRRASLPCHRTGETTTLRHSSRAAVSGVVVYITQCYSHAASRINERGTIEDRELAVLQMTAEALFELDLPSLDRALRAGELTEICDDEEPHTG